MLLVQPRAQLWIQLRSMLESVFINAWSCAWIWSSQNSALSVDLRAAWSAYSSEVDGAQSCAQNWAWNSAPIKALSYALSAAWICPQIGTQSCAWSWALNAAPSYALSTALIATLNAVWICTQSWAQSCAQSVLNCPHSYLSVASSNIGSTLRAGHKSGIKAQLWVQLNAQL